ncbi:hypothetical protein AB4425_17245, partial [Vibrio sp. 10N.261.51.A1]
MNSISTLFNSAWNWWIPYFSDYLYLPIDNFTFWLATGTAFSVLFIACIGVCKDDKSMIVMSYRALTLTLRLIMFVYLSAV